MRISQSSSFLTAGQTQQFSVADNTEPVTWSLSSAESVMGILSPSGLYTAPSVVASYRRETVIARSTRDPKRYGFATVLLVPTALSLSSTPSGTAGVDQSIRIDAIGRQSAGTLRWKLSPELGTLSAIAGEPGSMVYKAPPSIDLPQNVWITAVSESDPSHAAAIPIALSPNSSSRSPLLSERVSASSRPTAGYSSAPHTEKLSGDGNSSCLAQLLLAATIDGCDLVLPDGGLARVSGFHLDETATELAAKSQLKAELVPANPAGWGLRFHVAPSVRYEGSITIEFDVRMMAGANPSTAKAQVIGTVPLHSTASLSIETSDPTASYLSGDYSIALLSGSGVEAMSHGNYARVPGALWHQTLTFTRQEQQSEDESIDFGVMFYAPEVVEISPHADEVSAGGVRQFDAQVRGGDGNTGVFWSIRPNIGTISANGTYTAPPAVVEPLAVTVTATSLADQSKIGNATLWLGAPDSISSAATHTGRTLSAKIATPGAFDYKRTITISHSKISAALTNFPVLISLTDRTLAAVANSGHVSSASGYDIVFAQDSGCQTLLNFERQRWNAATGQLVAWVNVPSLSSSTDVVIYLCYGNPAVIADTSNKTAVWDANYVGVYHLADNAATNIVLDSTANGTTGINAANTSVKSVTGPFAGGAGLLYNGNSDYTDLSTSPLFDVTSGSGTWEFWINPKAINTYDTFLSRGLFGADGYTIQFFNQSVKPNLINFENDAAFSGFQNKTALTLATWQHIVFVKSGTNGTFYRNGRADGAAAIANFQSSGRHLYLGRDESGVNFSNIALSEVRFSNTARNYAWISSTYNNQSSPSTFSTLGPEVAAGTAWSTTTSSGAATVYSAANQAIQFAASVASSSGTVTAGTVTFTLFAGANQVGTPLVSQISAGSAAGAFTLPGGTPAGTYSIQAVYNGSGSIPGSTDKSQSLTVARAATSTAASNVTITASATSQTVTLAAAVTSPGGPVNRGAVTFCVYTSVCANPQTAPVINGSASVGYVVAGGSTAGVYTISASYTDLVSDGLNGFAASVDSTHTFAINAAVTGSKGSYAYSRAITLSHTKVAADLTNFPVLIALTDPTLTIAPNVGHVASPGGFDIVFGQDAACLSQLPFERQRWDGVTGQLLAWVNVPSLSSSIDTTLYLCYGNASISADQSSRSAVWDSNYTGVYHLSDNAPSQAVIDSTVNANTGTNAAFTAAKSVGGPFAGGTMGAALTYNGSTDYTDLTTSPLFNTTSGSGTWEFWIKPTSISSYQTFLSRGLFAADGYTFQFSSQNSRPNTLNVQNDAAYFGLPNQTALTTGVWQHLVFVKSGTMGTWYRNSMLDGTASISNFATSNRHLYLGRDDDAGNPANVSLAEVRFSNVARGSAWISTAYNNQASPSAFATIGSEGGSIPSGAATSTTVAANVVAPYKTNAQTVVLTAAVTSPLNLVNSGPVSFSVVPVGTSQAALCSCTQLGSTMTASVSNGAASVNFTVPANAPAGSYAIQATYGGSGSILASSDTQHQLSVTQSAASTPVIQPNSVRVQGLGHASFNLQFTAGTPNYYAQVLYGLSSGNYTYSSARYSSGGGTASISLGGLQPGTTYYVRPTAMPNATDNAGICSNASCGSTELQITTLPEPAIHPAPPAPPQDTWNPSEPDTTAYTIVPMMVSAANGECVAAGNVPQQSGWKSAVNQGDNITAILAKISYGTVIELPQGATCKVFQTDAYWHTGYQLPALPIDPVAAGDIDSPNHRWIVFRTQQVNAADFPPPGTRTGPQWASKLAKLVAQTPGASTSSAGTPPVGVQNFNGQIFDCYRVACHHFWFENLEWTHLADATVYPAGIADPPAFTDFIRFAPGDADVTTPATTPNYNVVDRVYAHTQPWPARQTASFVPGGKHWAITNSYAIAELSFPAVFPTIDPTIVRNVVVVPAQKFQFNAFDNTPIGMTQPATAVFNVPNSYTGTFYGWLDRGGLTIGYQQGPGVSVGCAGCSVLPLASPSMASVPVTSFYYFNGHFNSGAAVLDNSVPSRGTPTMLTAWRPMGIFQLPTATSVIDNNFISAIGQTYYNDTDGPHMDETWRHNYTWFPQSKMRSSPSWDGYGYSFRNIFETKQASRWLMDGNVFDGAAAYQNAGMALYIAGSWGGAYSTGTQDIAISNNILKHLASAFQCAGGGAQAPPDSPTAARIGLDNNLWMDLNQSLYNNGRVSLFSGFLNITPGCEDVSVTHNTVDLTLGPGPILLFMGGAAGQASVMGEGLNVSSNVMHLSLNSGDPLWSQGFAASPVQAVPASVVSAAGSPATTIPPPPPGVTAYQQMLDKSFLRVSSATGTTPSWTMANNVLLFGQTTRGASAYTDINSTATMNAYQAVFPNSGSSCTGGANCFPVGVTNSLAGRQAAIGWDPTKLGYPSPWAAPGSGPGCSQTNGTSSLPQCSTNFQGRAFRFTSSNSYVSVSGGTPSSGADVGAIVSHTGIVQGVSLATTPSSIQFTYTAPDARACSLDISPDNWTTVSRKSDGGGNTVRGVNFPGLSSGRTYSYRILCYTEQTQCFQPDAACKNTSPAFTGYLGDQLTNGVITLP